MNRIIVLGNGESRKNLDIKSIVGDSTVIGCNAIVRDYAVDHLVCVDHRMVKESLSSPRCPNSVYTRTEWLSRFKDPRVKPVPSLLEKGTHRWNDPFHWGSGPYAVLLAAQLQTDIVEMYGFDLYSSTNTVNNIYKGTDHYVAETHRPVDPSYWIKQLTDVFNWFPKTKFFIHNKKDWNIPQEWLEPNVTFC